MLVDLHSDRQVEVLVPTDPISPKRCQGFVLVAGVAAGAIWAAAASFLLRLLLLLLAALAPLGTYADLLAAASSASSASSDSAVSSSSCSSTSVFSLRPNALNHVVLSIDLVRR